MRKFFYFFLIIFGISGFYTIFHAHAKNEGPNLNNTSSELETTNPADENSSFNEDTVATPSEVDESQADVSEGKSQTVEISDYTVKSGDTLSTIAQDHNIHVATITSENDLNGTSVLQIGQVLRLLPIDALHYQVKTGDTLSEIAKKYDIDQKEIISVNSLDENSPLLEDQWLFLPGAEKMSAAETATTAPKTASSSPPPSPTTTTTTENSGEITWTADALAELNKIYLPAAIPVVRAKVEAYAKEHGITVITKEIYLQIHV